MGNYSEALASISAACELLKSSANAADFESHSGFLLDGLASLQAALLRTDIGGKMEGAISMDTPGIGSVPVVIRTLLDFVAACITATDTLLAREGADGSPQDIADFESFRTRVGIYRERASVDSDRESSVAVWQGVALPMLNGSFFGPIETLNFADGPWPKSKPPDIALGFAAMFNIRWYNENVTDVDEWIASLDTGLVGFRRAIARAIDEIGRTLPRIARIALTAIGIAAAVFALYKMTRQGAGTKLFGSELEQQPAELDSGRFDRLLALEQSQLEREDSPGDADE